MWVRGERSGLSRWLRAGGDSQARVAEKALWTSERHGTQTKVLPCAHGD